jgi:hypothetical protein
VAVADALEPASLDAALEDDAFQLVLVVAEGRIGVEDIAARLISS